MLIGEHLTKRYRGCESDALKDVNVSFREGECVAILGPNGAGKSTLLNMLAGLIEPTSGDVCWGGFAPKDAGYKSAMGFLPESNVMPDFLKCGDFYHMMGALHLLSKEERKARWREFSKVVEMPAKNKRISALSQGNRRKVLFAQALVNRPKILILDEPTVYLDLLVKHNLYNYLKELKQQGVTIVMASHVLSEIEKLADRIIVLRDGAVREEIDVKTFMANPAWEYEIIQRIV